MVLHFVNGDLRLSSFRLVIAVAAALRGVHAAHVVDASADTTTAAKPHAVARQALTRKVSELPWRREAANHRADHRLRREGTAHHASSSGILSSQRHGSVGVHTRHSFEAHGLPHIVAGVPASLAALDRDAPFAEDICPWFFGLHTNSPELLLCYHGECNPMKDSALFGCCADKGGIFQCPSTAPYLCKKKECFGDHCCKANCTTEDGGVRPCEAPPGFRGAARSAVDDSESIGAGVSDGVSGASASSSATESEAPKGAATQSELVQCVAVNVIVIFIGVLVVKGKIEKRRREEDAAAKAMEAEAGSLLCWSLRRAVASQAAALSYPLSHLRFVLHVGTSWRTCV
eukprot:TRINITY_DN11661_c0_g1_i2.p1 TRINITY_DN11661_c0_g1~~TRINITY_DN11661_c0_g1_i2.p1  ORF type:complete len:345 (+),score=35.73 TRINITY_DN11661_c0_g1_i2:57-1091(+)